MGKIYFVSSSKNKYDEIKAIGKTDPELKASIEWVRKDIPELQIEDGRKLVREKASKAFQCLRRPILIEHTALRIHAFNGLPGLQTSFFYSQFGYQSIVEYCNFKNDFQAVVESILCYCDGKQFFIGRGEEHGWIKKELDSIGTGFAWDKIFYPEEDNEKQKTYEEMGPQKNERSMRKKAWDDLKWQIQAKLVSTEFSEEQKIQELAELIKQRKVLLFIGAGISASIGQFPTWQQLIGDLGEKAEFERDLFETYGDNMMLTEFLDHDQVYEHLRENLSITGRDNLEKELSESEIYQALLKLDFPVIYTTNYDHLIEEYYKMAGRTISTVVNITDMEKVTPSCTRLMKFHGDIEDESSIVLSESHYFKRMDFQSFMDIQLQADLLKYHVLYLGYSLSDINIKLMLYLVRKRWEQGQTKKVSYIFTATPNMVQKDVFERNDIITFSGESDDKKAGTRKFLETLLKKIGDA